MHEKQAIEQGTNLSVNDKLTLPQPEIKIDRAVKGKSLADLYKRADKLDDQGELFLVATISAGSKFLKLSMTKDRRFVTYLNTTPNVDRQPGETTACYLEAKRFIQDLVNKSGVDAVYFFVTFEEKLQAWVRAGGNDVFHWSKIEVDDDVHPMMSAWADIKPQSFKRPRQ